MKAAILVVVALFLVVDHAHCEESHNISLNKIWAYKTPETRDIQELDAESVKLTGKALLDPISVSWLTRAEKMKWENLARPGFAVLGDRVTALTAAKAVFVDGQRPKTTFPSTKHVTLVLFSEPIGGTRVRIRSVSWRAGTINVQYELDQIIGGGNNLNLALIPIGNLPAGKYRVEITQVEPTTKPDDPRFKPLAIDDKWSRRYQCQPFEFRITETGA